MDKSIFDGYRIGEYQRDNFDKFLRAIHFRYDILTNFPGQYG